MHFTHHAAWVYVINALAAGLCSILIGRVRQHHVEVAAAPIPDAASEWLRLRDLWLKLPQYPNVLDPIGRGDGAKLLLRYAAIDWKHTPLDLQTSSRARIAMNRC